MSVQLFLTKTLLSLAKTAKGAKRSRAILKIASQAPGLKIDKIRFTKICAASRRPRLNFLAKIAKTAKKSFFYKIILCDLCER
ncbi:MAG: hypothetical protein BWK80_04620 [Desulfobacteraceae bacterium IS3]|nr:MAG: hypothetical protein BWK80_04620 [Desulfobacteraceae bacterium IS3]